MNKLIGFTTAILLTVSMAAAQGTTTITSMTAATTVINAPESGGTGFPFPTFNNGNATFAQVSADISHFVRFGTSGEWIPLDNNTSSGFIYGTNWGHYWEGTGGFWFHVNRTTYVRLQSRANPNVRIDYTINYNFANRDGFALTVYEGGTTLTANAEGNIGFVFPRIGGAPSRQADWGMFVVEIRINNQWRRLMPNGDPAQTTFHYAGNGYNNMSPENQFAQWWDAGLSGLWFRPVTQNYQVRIGYPANGQVNGDIDSNWLTYSFVGNPNAPRPDPSQFERIPLGTSSNPNIPGWTLHWNDEFNGTQLDRAKWTVDVGHFLGNNCNIPGWGNGEAQYYADDAANVFVQNGNLNLVAFPQRRYITCQGGGAWVDYASGKVHTRDKFSWKYGRIDFRAKLPAVNGAWPALWMMPQSDVYGGWAASGEIDVMEAMGRIPNRTSGAIHFGGAWPANTYLHGETALENDGRIDEFNVYTLIWTQDSLKWYVNGLNFFKVGHNQWHTTTVSSNTNPYAPFDQEFYIIMNLALGGWFDPGANLNPADFPATKQIDYVRVYKPGGGSTAVSAPANQRASSASFAGIKNGQINLRLQAGDYAVELINPNGRIVGRVDISATNGINSTGLRTDKLAKGMYILNVKQAGTSVLQRKISVR